MLAAYTHGGHDGQLISVPIGALAALRTFVALTVGGGAAGVPSAPLLILSSDKAVLTAADFVYDCDGKAKGCDGGGFFGCARWWYRMRRVVCHVACMLCPAWRTAIGGLALVPTGGDPFPLRPIPT